MSQTRLVVGCMTGTSLDGLDVALVRTSGRGLGVRAEVLGSASHGFDEHDNSWAGTLRQLADAGPCDTYQIANAANWFSEFHASAIRDLLAGSGVTRADLVCVHGQTVYHKPPASWQLFNPWPLVRAAGAPVVFDLRGADLAAGGQGAPITPLADWVLFRRAEPLTVVNLGGFCNITRLPGEAAGPEEIEGRDVCACNQVLDAVARSVFGEPFDAGGGHARAGRVHEEAVIELERALEAHARAGRSLGTGDMAWAWIHAWRERVGADLARCAVEGVARVVARACADGAVMLAGGGCRNLTLTERLGELCRGTVRTTADAGVPIEAREAACMAVLGALSQDRVPITLPGVTGVPSPAPVAGCWAYP